MRIVQFLIVLRDMTVESQNDLVTAPRSRGEPEAREHGHVTASTYMLARKRDLLAAATMSSSSTASLVPSTSGSSVDSLKRKREPEPFDWSSWTPRKKLALNGPSQAGLLHATIDELNAQTFPFGLLLRADDLLSHCLLQNKGSSLVGGRMPVVTPCWPLHDRLSIASLKERIEATNVIHKREGTQTTQSIQTVAQSLLDIPAFQLKEGWEELRQRWIKTLIQCVRW